MKALLLCAGYATRLYPLTLNQPKHLLPIADKPMLNYIMDKIEQVTEIDEVYLVTNTKFFPHFERWAKELKTTKKVKAFDDGTTSDETKLGAVGDIQLVIDKASVKDDLLVIAGDNLFRLDIKKFISFFKKKGMCIALFDVGDKELMKKYGEVKMDKDEKLISFREKPQEPETTLAAICMYLFPKDKLGLVKKYISEGNNPDQPGRYIQWLYRIDTVYGFVFKEGWYDIGDLNQYQQADAEYRNLP